MEKLSEPQDPTPDSWTVAVWEVELNRTCPVTPSIFRGATNCTQDNESEKVDKKGKITINEITKLDYKVINGLSITLDEEVQTIYYFE